MDLKQLHHLKHSFFSDPEAPRILFRIMEHLKHYFRPYRV
jgi:hypothetical protein